MKNIQDPGVYLSEMDNVFHQLRGHYLRLNILEHSDFIPEPELVEEVPLKVVEERRPMGESILAAKMRKLKYIKLRRKGGKTEEEDEPEKNLQTQGLSSYYSLDLLWKKLGENDESEKDGKKEKSWRQIGHEKQIEQLKEFSEKFKDSMIPEIWMEFRKNLLIEHSEGRFENASNIEWHKPTQRILEIKGLVINPACFYWNEK